MPARYCQYVYPRIISGSHLSLVYNSMFGEVSTFFPLFGSKNSYHHNALDHIDECIDAGNLDTESVYKCVNEGRGVKVWLWRLLI